MIAHSRFTDKYFISKTPTQSSLPQYLTEIRLGNEKQRFREIIGDVRDEFDLHSNNRPVPHLTLFGPYDTDQGYEVKQRTQGVLSKYSVVPFTVSGFDCFGETNVVYAAVDPSAELQSLRRDLAARLKPVTYNQQPWDLDHSHEFHITIATNLGDQTTAVLEYVRGKYDLERELHATRVPAVDRGRMLWEWDLPRGVELSPQEATSRDSWEQTMAELERLDEQAQSGLVNRIRRWISG